MNQCSLTQNGYTVVIKALDRHKGGSWQLVELVALGS